jgi:DNA gyrase/topoisomerase IV subunit B
MVIKKVAKATVASEPDLAQQYQRKTDKQHILDNPDTYIGSVENVDAQMWVFDDVTKKIVLKDIEYIPGLYKLFDEGIVNCRDHVIRMIQSNNMEKKFVTYIDTTISDDGVITMSNDGNGIDVAKHPEYDLWIPEMIFGHLRTSTNYNKDEKKIVGGKNGFGFKLVLIWSEYGKVETVDHVRGLKYVQEFKRNLDEICPPVITKVSTSTKPYTKVTFKPDYARLGIHGLTSDMLSLLKKRVYDIGAVTDHSIKKIKVGLNDSIIPIKNFQQYIDLYIGSKEETKRVYEQSDERWEYAVAMSPTHEFIQVSFVNGIATFKGGKHVDYIVGQIVRKLCDYIEKKKKIKVNSSAIKEQLILFLRCDVENPSFDSQTKDFMNTPSSKFGSSCQVSDAFIEKVAKMGVMDLACSLTEAKESKLAKKTDGSKTKSIRGIANFIDANNSGTVQSKDCILILCEGLSALSGIVSGLSSSDRNNIGIYPLKGKVLNVRGEVVKRIAENKEISELKKIMGLETGRVYDSIEDVHKNLRYGKVMFLTDADLDGSHIKGLCINLFHSEWASLIKIPGFLSFMNTPILRAKKGAQMQLFYNDGEYSTWKESNSISGWTIKYFKGLGTSTAVEFKEYFANKKIVDFIYDGQVSDDAIDKVFNKKRPDDRKTWLENYDKNAYLDTRNPQVKYEQFIDREMIHFSTYDCARSIPNMVDGLKISLRKILFGAFKRRLTNEIKVAQFSGYVSEHSAYHHGEASLNGAIVNMAQNFVGSNNINLLEPHGQFGCLAPDTKILMWDGSIKQAKDVIVDDKLVGDDGQPRKVLRTTNGVDDMYEICDAKGMNVTVNSLHILTLYFPKNMEIYWKESASSWKMMYFDNDKITEKAFRTCDKKTNTSDHFNKSILTKEEAYNKIVEFKQSISEKYSTSKIIDIKLVDYIKLSDSNKRRIFTVNNMNPISWEKKEVPISPYIFGAWLGDGDHSGCGMTTIDDELVKEYAVWADTINCELTHQNNSGRDDCYHYGIRRKNSGKMISVGDKNNSSRSCIACINSKKTHPSCDWTFEKTQTQTIYGTTSHGQTRSDLNPLKELLKKNNLYKNKHIPDSYIFNDEFTRLELLAGFVDTDGCIRKNNGVISSIEISQSERLHGNLIDKLDYICKTLGFYTTISLTSTDKKTQEGLDRTMKCLRIFGDLERIPMRVERKKIIKTIKSTISMHHQSFVVKHIGKGEFCGWSIDSNERFLLGNFMVTHNSRLQGGDDSASERYIFTMLNPLTRSLFPEADDAVLHYLDDDGTTVEPEYYVPILPFALVNGISGIGTGFSCNIEPYNPKQLIQYLRNKLSNQTNAMEFVPYYEGFGGEVIKMCENKYLIKGKYERLGDDKIRITELPVGTWTMPYTTFLEGLLDGGVDKAGKKILPTIKDFTSTSTEVAVDFTVVFPKDKLRELEESIDTNGCNGVMKTLKLFTTVSTTNMHMFNSECKLHKYGSVEEIIDDFYGVRMTLYQKRKDYLVAAMSNKLVKLSNRARYIQEVLKGAIDLRKKTGQQVTDLLTSMNFVPIDGDFKYLIKMPMDSVTEENVANIMKEKADTEEELALLRATTLETMWLGELSNLEKEYDVYKKKRETIQMGKSGSGSGSGDKKKMVIKKGGK